MSKDPAIENRPILVVEDDEDLAEIVTNRLSSEGYATQCAYTWKDAQEIIEDQMPDLLIMDLNLPDAHGMDVIERLRSDPRTRRLAIVVTSAEDDTEHLVRGIRSGVLFFLTKPFELDELVRKVRSAVFQRFEMENPEKNTGSKDGD
jgi:DNA-binding response OmpR family regulator